MLHAGPAGLPYIFLGNYRSGFQIKDAVKISSRADSGIGQKTELSRIVTTIRSRVLERCSQIIGGPYTCIRNKGNSTYCTGMLNEGLMSIRPPMVPYSRQK